MRLVIVLVGLLLFPVSAQAEYWDGDNLLACLVGQGAVELRHGLSPDDALSSVRDQCFETAMEPDPGQGAEGEWGDYVDYIFSVAHTSLVAIDAADTGF